MRITQQMVTAQVLSGIQNAGSRALGLQEQLATGKRINRPSDDPAGVSQVISLRSRIAGLDQFDRNIGAALDRLAGTENALSGGTDVLSRAQVLAERGASDTSSPEVRDGLATEVNGLLEELFALGNSRTDGRSLFAGTADDQAAFTATRDAGGEITAVAAAATGDQNLTRQVGDGETETVNIAAGDAFGTSGSGTDLFQLLITLRDNLRANDADAVRTQVTSFPDAQGQLTASLAVVGSRTNRLNALRDRLGLDKTTNQAALSRVEDANVAETVVNLQAEQTALQAALQTGAQIIRVSLLDYLT